MHRRAALTALVLLLQGCSAYEDYVGKKTTGADAEAPVRSALGLTGVDLPGASYAHVVTNEAQHFELRLAVDARLPREELGRLLHISACFQDGAREAAMRWRDAPTSRAENCAISRREGEPFLLVRLEERGAERLVKMETKSSR
jgi:hypothetical protein